MARRSADNSADDAQPIEIEELAQQPDEAGGFGIEPIHVGNTSGIERERDQSKMVRRICNTCKGTRRVRYGARMYICPTCRGSGGLPMGEPPPDLTATLPLDGRSQAAQNIIRNRPMPLPMPKRPGGRQH